ncbi:MAG: hypothetical protein H7A53_06765 [Akkermansiaceae bacterium]|nr:hypothetical protein [Akkermansiaceae bacterium]MCP5550574.1 hypothetical protein [Akkermansiaceae bacterium]
MRKLVKFVAQSDPERWLVGLYALVALLAGGLAFRQCLAGIGMGSSRENAVMASFATTAMVFILVSIGLDPWPLRIRWILGSLVAALLTAIHFFAFSS